MPDLPGTLDWDTSQLYTSGVLSVAVPGLSGDYNQNGTVDAADYVVWRNGLGTIYTQDDYTMWRANFGRSFASGAAGAPQAPVPEPAAISIITLAIILTMGTGQRRSGMACC